MMSMFVLYSYC